MRPAAVVLIATLVLTGRAQAQTSTIGTASTSPPSDRRPLEIAQAEWRATGGRSWGAIAGVVLEGTVTEGGQPEPFVTTLDLNSGRHRMLRQSGLARTWSGYDSLGWDAGNGIVNGIDLPSLVADARTQAFIDRAGWRVGQGYRVARFEDGGDSAVVHYLPEGGSAVAVTFDSKTHRALRTVIDTEGGPITTTFDDWRRVGPVWFAFRQVRADNVGQVTTIAIERARLLAAVPSDSLVRPERSPHGRLASGAPARVAFEFKGSHIQVPVRIDGFDANVIFDTGAANYIAPGAAHRFGLNVSGGLNLSGVGESSTTGGYAMAKTITLGSAELIDENIVVGPVPWPIPPGQEATSAVGFVGYEFLAEFRTTIDYPARTITLASFDSVPTPSSLATTIPFYMEGHAICVEAEVEGHKGLFRLDTGDGNTVTLFPAFASAHSLHDLDGEQAASGGGVGGGVMASRITLSKFRLAGAVFQDLPARLSRNKAGAFAPRSLAGNIGGGLLRCFRITFDYRARTVTFDAEPEHIRDCAALQKR